MRRWPLRGLKILVAGSPCGRAHTNPPVTGEPAWDSPTTWALTVRPCLDCHSHKTAWPWYSNIAPMSWLQQRHVGEGRQKLVFSAWRTSRQEVEHPAGQVSSGEMPPRDNLVLHADARLSDAEKQQLIDGLTKTPGSSGE